MQPGPTLIKKCTECGQLLREHGFPEYYTGYPTWIDWEFLTDLFYDMPKLVKCPACSELLWINQLDVIASVYHTEYYPGAIDYKDPSLRDYYTALKSPTINRDSAVYLRLQAWRKGNDKRREMIRRQSPFLPLTQAETENLQELAWMLREQNDHDRLLKAEVKRELGLFAEALALLKKPFQEDLDYIAEFIKKLADKKDRWVREIGGDVCL